LTLVPTGAGQSRQLTHDDISYGMVRYLPDGKHLLAAGIEPGHGARDYLIDVGTGNSTAVTPEGVGGVLVSPDGRSVAVTGPDGKIGIWTFGESAVRPIPGLDSSEFVEGWTPDGQFLYMSSRQGGRKTAKVYRVNIATGKMEFWKEFGADLPAGTASVGRVQLSSGTNAYAYSYDQTLSETYLVKGFK
jgi:Tol biopolymer transport system component